MLDGWISLSAQDILSHMWLLVCAVSAGGENLSEAAHRLRGVLGVQQSSVHQRGQHSGQQERFISTFSRSLTHSLDHQLTHSLKRCHAGVKPWSYLMEVLEEKNGSDTELLIYAMTLINKVTRTQHAAADLMCQLCVCVTMCVCLYVC